MNWSDWIQTISGILVLIETPIALYMYFHYLQTHRKDSNE
jgi:hypothetical protein